MSGPSERWELAPSEPGGAAGALALLDRVGLPTDDLAGVPPARFRTVERDGRTVGCVAVLPYGADGLLRSLAVAPEARGRGLGAALVGAAEALARASGLASLTLLTESAAPFFERHGYRRISREDAPAAVQRSAQFTGEGCSSCATCMAKRLV